VQSERERADDLIDRWEAAADREPGLSPGEFLERESESHTANVRDEFLLRARKLAGIDHKIALLRPPSRPEPTPAQLFPGFEPIPGYRLERLLGSGGFGQVWRASGPGGVPTALKFVPLGRRVTASEWRAVSLMKEVRHPHLIAVSGSWEASGYLVVAMEPADGSLADRLRECNHRGLPGIPSDELWKYMSEAAQALDFLNEPRHPVGSDQTSGIQHRDVKPQNLLLLGGGVKVADFGLARALSAALTAHTGHMTISYAAPEFLTGKTSARSDQYSLAVTYCHLRGGQLPFAGSPAEVTLGHLHKEPDLSMVPPVEWSAVARALAKRPEDRWQSCTIFVETLIKSKGASVNSTLRTPQTLLASNESRKASPSDSTPSDPEVPVRRRSHRAIVIGSGILLTASIIIAFFALGQQKRENGLVIGDQDAAISPSPAQPPLSRQGARLIRRIDLGGEMNAVAITPDGRRAACGRAQVNQFEAGVGLFDLETGEHVREFAGKSSDARGHTDPIVSVEFSPDGQTLCSTGRPPFRDLILWNVENGRKARHEVGQFAAFIGHQKLFSAAHDDIDVIELPNGPSKRFARASADVTGLACSTDGTRLLSLNQIGLAEVWDCQTGKRVVAWDVPEGVPGTAAFNANGEWVLIGMRVYSLPTGREIARLNEGSVKATATALSRDGHRAVVATADKGVIVWDTATGNALYRLEDIRGAVNAVAFTPDGTKLVAVSSDGGLYFWAAD